MQIVCRHWFLIFSTQIKQESNKNGFVRSRGDLVVHAATQRNWQSLCGSFRGQSASKVPQKNFLKYRDLGSFSDVKFMILPPLCRCMTSCRTCDGIYDLNQSYSNLFQFGLTPSDSKPVFSKVHTMARNSKTTKQLGIENHKYHDLQSICITWIRTLHTTWITMIIPNNNTKVHGLGGRSCQGQGIILAISVRWHRMQCNFPTFPHNVDPLYSVESKSNLFRTCSNQSWNSWIFAGNFGTSLQGTWVLKMIAGREPFGHGKISQKKNIQTYPYPNFLNQWRHS